MAKTLIVANWKMHLNIQQASFYVNKLSKSIPVRRNVEVVLCPGFLALQPLSLQVNHRQFKLGAQNAHWRDEGPYTGEVAATMLRGLVKYVILGHSERRHGFGESNKDVRSKVQAAIRNHIQPIVCVGETASERADNETKHILHDQVTAALANVTSEEIDEVVIAYEPVWALSTSKDRHDPTPEEITQAVKYIRSQVATMFGDTAGRKIRVLYGGNVTIHNAEAHLSVPGVDGALVGGASLHADLFTRIVEIAHARQEK